jgi:ATP-binding cassette subfamily B multidrug efflux pump
VALLPNHAPSVQWRGVEEEVSGKLYDGRILKRLVRYLAPYRGRVAATIGTLLVLSALETLRPLITKTAIDYYILNIASAMPPWLAERLPKEAIEGLGVIALIYLLILTVDMFVEFTQGYLMASTGQRAMLDLRRDLFSKLQRLDVAYYDSHPVGRLVTRITNDVDALNELFSSGIATIFGDFVALTFVVIAMWTLSPGLTLILLGVLPLVVVAAAIFRRSVSASYRRTRVAVAKINAYLQEHVNGIVVLQLFNREPRAREGFDAVNREHMVAFKDSVFAYGWFYPVVEFLSLLALAGLLTYGGYQTKEGQISLGVMVAFFQYGLRFFRPIQDLSEKYNILQSATAASERVLKLLDTEPTIVAPAAPRRLPAGPLAIEFDQVWFAYKGEDWILKGVSFRIEPGETVAVVGHTGAGKTTLMSLLQRFYDVQRGSIRIGGIDIRELDPADLRSRFGVVLQDAYLFSGTLAENIRLGTEGIPDSVVEQSASQVNLLDYVQSLPEGFRHELRERGAGLSTGQKQLVSFARALAHDPVVLILDEATSSVDTETEVRIREALDRLVSGRTSIVIAHRLSTIQRADRILVMHKGELRESGTHQQLLSQRGIYFRLFQLQYQEQERKVSNSSGTENGWKSSKLV